MSFRTLIEINHDLASELKRDPEKAISLLVRYLSSASRESAEPLERYGIRVVGMRHHSGKFIVEGEPDGFPVQHLPAPHKGGR